MAAPGDRLVRISAGFAAGGARLGVGDELFLWWGTHRRLITVTPLGRETMVVVRYRRLFSLS